MNTTWTWLRDTKMEKGDVDPQDTFVVSHAIPEELYRDVLAHLCENHNLVHYEAKESTGLSMDAGGMCRVDEKDFTVEIDGLKVAIPARCFEQLYDHWSTVEARTYLSQPYFKFPAWPSRFLCLTAPQRDSFISKMQELLPEARAFAQAEAEAFNEMLRGANKGRMRIAARPRETGKAEA